MLIGYIRTMGAGWSIAKQKAALSAAGIDLSDEFAPVYIDERDNAISSMAAGDVLAVASASCLGHPEHDILAALAEIGRRGGRVRDLQTGLEISMHPNAQVAIEFAVRGGTSTRQAVAAKARKARAASGNYGGVKPIDWDRQKLDQLRAMMVAGITRQEMADALGISRPTLQRKLRKLRSGSE